jgi:iron complex transport system substrate-binding protein
MMTRFSTDIPPRRVVSLVPSMTESLFDLGLGSVVVGITDYCIHPAQKLVGLKRVGGPKTARIDQILELHPDLVIVSKDENDRSLVEELQRQGIPVWVTFPCRVTDAIQDLWNLAEIFRSEAALVRLRLLETAVEFARLANSDVEPVSYFCPIWQENSPELGPWWMTFNRNTYIHDLLELMGGRNIFAERERRQPLAADLGQQPPVQKPGSDLRYPRVTLAEIIEAQPQVILLPSEPFPYSESDIMDFKVTFGDTPAAQNNRIIRVDGGYITWPGTRLGKAVSELGDLFMNPAA